MLLVGVFLVMTALVSFAKSQTNLALSRPAYQSGQMGDLSGDKAVDGNFQTIIDGTFQCTHTEDDMNTPTPWWTVDLQGFYYISSVNITNKDNCCPERLSDFKVMVGDQFLPETTGITEISTWKQCAHVPGQIELGETGNFQCAEVHSGRFLSIYLDHNGILNLCEVQVFEYPDISTRVFPYRKQDEKVHTDILTEIWGKTKRQCAMYCFQDNTCTQFSYHSNTLGNNCLLGSATSQEENEDGWVTFST